MNTEQPAVPPRNTLREQLVWAQTPTRQSILPHAKSLQSSRDISLCLPPYAEINFPHLYLGLLSTHSHSTFGKSSCSAPALQLSACQLDATRRCSSAKHSHLQPTITDFRGLLSAHYIIPAVTIFVKVTEKCSAPGLTFILFKVYLKWHYYTALLNSQFLPVRMVLIDFPRLRILQWCQMNF